MLILRLGILGNQETSTAGIYFHEYVQFTTRALLMSEEFTPTDKSSSGPLCLRFWTHMYGNGIGSLNVYVRGASSGDIKIWGLTGDAGNNWYMGQAPIAATENFRARKQIS